MSSLNHFANLYIGTQTEREGLDTAGLKRGTGWLETDTDQITFWSGTVWIAASDFVLTAPSTAAQNTIVPLADIVPLTIQGFATQADNLQEWKKGDGTLVAAIEDDGTLVFSNDGIVYDDLRVPVNAVRVPGSKAPTWTAWSAGGGVLGFSYQAVAGNEEEVYFVMQLPHKWVEGSNIHIHIHWAPNEDTIDDPEVVRWGLEYEWVNIGDVFNATTTIYAEESINDQEDEHIMTEFAEIDGTGKTVSSMLNCRLFRNSSHANDTFDNGTAMALLLEVDAHIQIDTLGSRSEYVK